MTSEQAKAASSEYRALFEQVTKQLAETKAYMQAQVDALPDNTLTSIMSAIGWSAVSPRDAVCGSIQAIAVTFVRVDVVHNAESVSVIYEWPDTLYAFLRHAGCPEALKCCLYGGTPLDEEELTWIEPADDETRQTLKARREAYRKQ